MSEGIISPLSLSSESSEQLRKFSNGSNNGVNNGSNLSVNSSNSSSNGGSFKKSNSILYNGPIPSINDGKELVLDSSSSSSCNNSNNKPKVVELVNTFNHRPISTIHSVHNEVPPPAIEKEKKEIINNLTGSGVSIKYLTTFEILDNAINTPLASCNRNRSGSTGSRPTVMPNQVGGILAPSSSQQQQQQPSSISITASSSPPLSSDIIDQPSTTPAPQQSQSSPSSFNNSCSTTTTNTNKSTTTTTAATTATVTNQKTAKVSLTVNTQSNQTTTTTAATTTTTTTAATTTQQSPTSNNSSNNNNNKDSSLHDLLFNLPTTPNSVPRISTVPKKLSANKLLIPPSSNVPPTTTTTTTTAVPNLIIPIVQLPPSSPSSTTTTNSVTTPRVSPRLSQPSTSLTQLVQPQQQQQLNELNNSLINKQQQEKNNNTNNNNASSSSSSSSTTTTSTTTTTNNITQSTSLSTTPTLLGNKFSPTIQRSSTQYIISTNNSGSTSPMNKPIDFNNLGNFGNNSGERVKSKQYSMLNISKKTIIDESELSSPRGGGGSNSSPNSIRASISSQLPPSLSVSSTTPTNKPLVVKKMSTSEHIKKENIWRQTMAPSTKEDHIKVVFDGIPGKRVIQKFLIDKTPIEIKTKFFEDLGLSTDFNLSSLGFSTSPEHYDLKVLSINSVINNETLPLRRQMLMQACNISRLFPKLHLVLKDQQQSIVDDANNNIASNGNKITKSNSSSTLMIDNSEVMDVKGHIQAELEIFELIGTSFTRVLDQGQEVVSFRRDFAQFRLANFTSSRNDISQLIYVSSEPLPLQIPNKITIMVLLPGDGKIIKRVDCDPQSSITDVKKEIFKKFAMIDRVHTQGKTHDSFVLKVTGFREYILCIKELGNLTSRQRFYPTGSGGDFALIDYDYIRQCVGKNQIVELSLTGNSILALSQVEEKVSFIDKILETSDYDDYDEELDSISSNSFEDIKQTIQPQQTVINTNNTTTTTTTSTTTSNGNTPMLITQPRGSVDSDGGVNGNSGSGVDSPSSSSNNQNLISQPTLLNANNLFLPNSSKLPINIVKRLFRVNIAGLRNINFNNNEEARSKFVDKPPNVFVMAELYYGGELLTNPVYTPITQINSFDGNCSVEFPNWEKGIAFTIPIRYLPRAARASFTVFATTASSDVSESQMDEVVAKSIPIGWCNCLLMNHKGMLRMGPTAFRLWEDGGRRANPIGTCVDNQAAKAPIILLVEFESFIRPIVYVDAAASAAAASIDGSGTTTAIDSSSSSTTSSSSSSSSLPTPPTSPSPPVGLKKLELEEARRLKLIMDSDPLFQFTAEDKKLVYNYRHIYKSKPKALAKFLLSVNWIDQEQVSEAYRQMNDWALLKPVQALEILDAKFADEHVRNFAIKIVNSFSDAEFSDFLLQLTQVLKYEPYHNSDLTHVLIQRALANRSRIGHFFFWFLKSEMHTPEIEERYGLLLEGYLRSCGSHRQDLIKQNQVLKSLHTVAMAVKNTNGSSERKKVLLDGLSKIKFPDTFQLPLDPRWEAKGLIVEKCRYMDSKKLPLWLVFENVEPHAKPLTVIFKVGDDLRQDTLTLQVLRIMDKFWKNAGMDLRLQPYKCISTGDGIGMLEVVLNANTIANINKDAGGTGAILEEKTLVNWLRECNKTDAEFNKAVETFILSCAGYVVATYVMGIGDRHADNIMITKLGHLFHIDFGHFLGNYKKKYGFKRERAPFIFTPQYMAIVGGKDSENFKRFVTTCCTAYNILRKNTDLFLNLFQLMLSTGIPELQVAEDIDYLRKALAPGLSDEEAADEFTKNITVALNTKTTLINDIFHGLKHA